MVFFSSYLIQQTKGKHKHEVISYPREFFPSNLKVTVIERCYFAAVLYLSKIRIIIKTKEEMSESDIDNNDEMGEKTHTLHVKDPLHTLTASSTSSPSAKKDENDYRSDKGSSSVSLIIRFRVNLPPPY